MRWKSAFLLGLGGLLASLVLAGQDAKVLETPSIDESMPESQDASLLVSVDRSKALRADPGRDDLRRSALWHAIELADHESSVDHEPSGRRLTSEQLLELRAQIRQAAASSAPYTRTSHHQQSGRPD